MAAADHSFVHFLQRRYVTKETLAVLVKEGVTDKETFGLLGWQHMDKLFTILPLGEHAKPKKVLEVRWYNCLDAEYSPQRCTTFTPFKKPPKGSRFEPHDLAS